MFQTKLELSTIVCMSLTKGVPSNSLDI